MCIVVISVFLSVVHLQNEELISASKTGDIVRVTSLLNSGADIHTVDDNWVSRSH